MNDQYTIANFDLGDPIPSELYDRCLTWLADQVGGKPDSDQIAAAAKDILELDARALCPTCGNRLMDQGFASLYCGACQAFHGREALELAWAGWPADLQLTWNGGNNCRTSFPPGFILTAVRMPEGWVAQAFADTGEARAELEHETPPLRDGRTAQRFLETWYHRQVPAPV